MLALWLVFGYPLSMGPACYFCERAWLTPLILQTVYRPLMFMGDPQDLAPLVLLHARYCNWWSVLGQRHDRAAWELQHDRHL